MFNGRCKILIHPKLNTRKPSTAVRWYKKYSTWVFIHSQPREVQLLCYKKNEELFSYKKKMVSFVTLACIVCPREIRKKPMPALVSPLSISMKLTMPIVSYAYRLLMRIQRSLLLCFSALLHRKKYLIHLRFSFTRSSSCSFCVLPSLLLSHLQRKSVNVKTTR